jgi:hypothetical protein
MPLDGEGAARARWHPRGIQLLTMPKVAKEGDPMRRCPTRPLVWILVALGLTLSACGGDEHKDHEGHAGHGATGTTK